MKLIVEGNISVKATILGNKREIYEVIVDKDKHDKDTNYILAKAYERNIKVIKTTREQIDKLCSGKTHGGLIALVSSYNMININNLKNFDKGYIALIEGVEDPFNLGQIIRTCYANGAIGIILNPRNWDNSNNILVKSSAGASEYLNIYTYDNAEDVINICNKYNINITSAYRKEATNLYDYKFNNKELICIGGEMRGLSKPFINNANNFIYIPYDNDFRNALGGVSATSIITYEYYRQIKMK